MLNSAIKVRQSNSQNILALVLHRGPITRTRLSEITGLTGAAVSRITRELISKGALVERGEIVNKRRAGRREVMLEVSESYKFVFGVTLTGNRRTIVLASGSGVLVTEKDITDLDLSDPEKALKSIAQDLRSLAAGHKLSMKDIAGVAVSMSITATGSTEVVTSAPLGWESVQVRQLLEAELGLPVVVEARATSILRAELLKGGTPDSIFLINVALGVGSSAFLNGALVQPGTAGFGGLTHLAIHGDQTLCYCGRRGCLEVCGGGSALLDSLGKRSDVTAEKNSRIAKVLDQAYRGEPDAIRAIKLAASKMAVGVDVVLSLFEPEKIILTGIVGRHEVYRMGVIESLRAMGRDTDSRHICTSELTSSNATIWLALEKFIATGLVSTLEY